MLVQVSTVSLSEQAMKMLLLSTELENLQREEFRHISRLREVKENLSKTQCKINIIESALFELKREISA